MKKYNKEEQEEDPKLSENQMLEQEEKLPYSVEMTLGRIPYMKIRLPFEQLKAFACIGAPQLEPEIILREIRACFREFERKMIGSRYATMCEFEPYYGHYGQYSKWMNEEEFKELLKRCGPNQYPMGIQGKYSGITGIGMIDQWRTKMYLKSGGTEPSYIWNVGAETFLEACDRLKRGGYRLHNVWCFEDSQQKYNYQATWMKIKWPWPTISPPNMKPYTLSMKLSRYKYMEFRKIFESLKAMLRGQRSTADKLDLADMQVYNLQVEMVDGTLQAFEHYEGDFSEWMNYPDMVHYANHLGEDEYLMNIQGRIHSGQPQYSAVKIKKSQGLKAKYLIGGKKDEFNQVNETALEEDFKLECIQCFANTDNTIRFQATWINAPPYVPRDPVKEEKQAKE